MSVEANKQILLKMYKASAEGDFETYLSCLADDVAYTITGEHKFGRTFHGKQDMIDNLFAPLADVFDGVVVMHIGNMIGEGDFVAFEGRGEARTKSGMPYNNTYCIVARFRDGKISELREYMDTALSIRAVG